MKRLIFLFALACSCTATFAQRIHFTDTSNYWKVISFDPDRAIGSQMWHFAGNVLQGSVVREDTVTHKVYAISNHAPDYDTNEHLVYDYKLQMGDTIKTHYARHVVTAIDSIQMNGSWYKLWDMHGIWADSVASTGMMLTDYKVLEGLGCLSTPMFPDFPFTFEIYGEVVCFENKSIRPTFSSNPIYYFDNTASCTKSFGLSVANVGLNVAQPALYPNPVNEATRLYLPANFEGAVTITKVDGSVVYSQEIKGGNSILIADKITAPGLYFYRTNDSKTGSTASGKFIK